MACMTFRNCTIVVAWKGRGCCARLVSLSLHLDLNAYLCIHVCACMSSHMFLSGLQCSVYTAHFSGVTICTLIWMCVLVAECRNCSFFFRSMLLITHKCHHTVHHLYSTSHGHTGTPFQASVIFPNPLGLPLSPFRSQSYTDQLQLQEIIHKCNSNG